LDSIFRSYFLSLTTLLSSPELLTMIVWSGLAVHSTPEIFREGWKILNSNETDLSEIKFPLFPFEKKTNFHPPKSRPSVKGHFPVSVAAKEKLWEYSIGCVTICIQSYVHCEAPRRTPQRCGAEDRRSARPDSQSN
jgi:hypothetical protein